MNESGMQTKKSLVLGTINPTEETRNREKFHRYWSQFDTVGLEFAYMMEGNYLLSDTKQRLAQNGVDSNDLKLRQWTSFLGIDMTMLELEDQFINLVNNIDKRMYNLVQRSKQEIKSNSILTAKDVEILKENANNNWQWLQSLSEAVQKHLKNASDYHLFYQTLLQYQLAIPNIGTQERIQMNRPQYEGNYGEANDIFKSIKSHLSQYFSWWQRIESLISQSRKLNPIESRIEKTDTKIPVTMLTDYKDHNITFHKGEKLLRYKNDNPQRWGIENIHQDQIKDIPSICAEICPPDINCIEDALLLRLDLLANWTTAIKEIGGVLMDYIARILEYWTKPNFDISSCRSQGNTRNSISESLSTMETLLNNYWMGSPQLGFLQSRINELRTELELNDDNDIINDETHINRNTMFIDISPLVLERSEDSNSSPTLSKSETLTCQKRAVTILISKYKDLHKNWEMYKNLVEKSSDLSIICENKVGTNAFPEDLSRSEQLLSFLSSDDQLAWSKYLELLIANNQNSGNNKTSDKYPLINILPRKLELQSKNDTYDYKNGKQNSQINISIPAEKEIRFFQKQPISIYFDDVITSSVDISRYFTKSLLPTDQQIKTVQQSQVKNAENRLAKKFLESALSRSKTIDNEDFTNKSKLKKYNSDVQSSISETSKTSIIIKKSDHIQSFYLILNMPRNDRIANIVDRKRKVLLTASKAQAEGLCDETFLEILDTESSIKYSFHSAVTRGLVILNFNNVNKSHDKSIFTTDDNYNKVVYKIDEILDTDKNELISLKEAVNRGVVNSQNGLLKISKNEFRHIVKAINSVNVRGRRLYHCNAKSLPPEMTIEISRML